MKGYRITEVSYADMTGSIRRPDSLRTTTRIHIFLGKGLEYADFRARGMRKLAAQILWSRDIAVDEKDLRWDQYAGCSCGCSPAVVWHDPTGKVGNFYATVEAE